MCLISHNASVTFLLCCAAYAVLLKTPRHEHMPYLWLDIFELRDLSFHPEQSNLSQKPQAAPANLQQEGEAAWLVPKRQNHGQTSQQSDSDTAYKA